MTATYNLVCPQATTFNFQFTINTANSNIGDSTPWDLDGYTATMTVRPAPGVNTTTLLATTANGRIVIDPTYGRLTVTFNAALTAIPPRSYVYDLVLYSGDIVTRILEGQFIVTAGVTV